MTYFEYSAELINGLRLSRQSVWIIFVLLNGNKGYLDDREKQVYLTAVKQLVSETEEVKKFLQRMINGEVSPYDEIEL